MSARAMARRRDRGDHIHLPSVHVRGGDSAALLADPEGSGFDYEEDLYVEDRGRRVRRVVKFAFVEDGQPTLVRETRDVLCHEELAALKEVLPLLMDQGNPEAEALMEERGRAEFARQIRIGNREENWCRACGCSDSRSCSGGCIWATRTLCSKCV